MHQVSSCTVKGKRWLVRIIGRFCRACPFPLFPGRFPAPPSEVEEAEWAFYDNYLKEGMVAFDVGANVGRMSVLFSRLVGQEGEVHAFEPSIRTFRDLEENCAELEHRNVVLNQLALSDQPGIVHLWVYDDEHSSWSTLADRPLKDYGIEVEPVTIEEVEATTIDAYCQQEAIPKIDLLKIDVEGAEYQVLLGAQRMLSERRISCCIFEFGPPTYDMGNDPSDIQAYLNQLQYRLRNVIDDDPVLLGVVDAPRVRFSMYPRRAAGETSRPPRPRSCGCAAPSSAGAGEPPGAAR